MWRTETFRPEELVAVKPGTPGSEHCGCCGCATHVTERGHVGCISCAVNGWSAFYWAHLTAMRRGHVHG